MAITYAPVAAMWADPAPGETWPSVVTGPPVHRALPAGTTSLYVPADEPSRPDRAGERGNLARSRWVAQGSSQVPGSVPRAGVDRESRRPGWPATWRPGRSLRRATLRRFTVPCSPPAVQRPRQRPQGQVPRSGRYPASHPTWWSSRPITRKEPPFWRRSLPTGVADRGTQIWAIGTLRHNGGGLSPHRACSAGRGVQRPGIPVTPWICRSSP